MIRQRQIIRAGYTLFWWQNHALYTDADSRAYLTDPQSTPLSERDTLRHAHLGNRYRWEDPIPRTEASDQADISVTSTYTGNLSFLDIRLGTANLTRLEQGRYTVSSTNPQAQRNNADQSSNATVDFTVEVVLVLESDGTTGELSQEEMRTVCLHEFGHAIGLWGHSPNTDDVCHAMATAQHPTPRDINTLLKIYDIPLHTSQHDIAIDLLKKEIQTNPRLARPHYLLGAVYFDKGDMASAIPNFQDCLGVDPNYEPAREKLIQAYQKTGQSSQAARLVEQGVKSQQGHRSLRQSAESYNRLGTLHYQRRMGCRDSRLPRRFGIATDLSNRHGKLD